MFLDRAAILIVAKDEIFRAGRVCQIGTVAAGWLLR